MFICQLIPFLFYVPLSLFLIFYLEWGAFGVAMGQFIINLAVCISMAGYIWLSGVYKRTWDGFSLKVAFSNWGPFLR